jgi:proteasome accessory factor A
VATYVRIGTMNAVLGLLESGAWDADFLASVRLADPVGAFHRVSRDLTLSEPLRLASGGSATALEIQRRYLSMANDSMDDAAGSEAWDVARRWGSLLDRLEQDPELAAREVEWVAKLRILDGLRRRGGLEWDSPRLAAADLQWTDVRPERGLAARLAAAGAVDVLFGEAQVARAVDEPPPSTRAYLRGMAVGKHGAAVAAANWDSLTLELPGEAALRRWAMPDPFRSNAAEAGEAMAASATLEELLARLA